MPPSAKSGLRSFSWWPSIDKWTSIGEKMQWIAAIDCIDDPNSGW